MPYCQCLAMFISRRYIRYMSSVDTKPFLVRLPSEMAAQLDAKARAEDRSKSSFVRRAIQAALVDTRASNSSYSEESER